MHSHATLRGSARCGSHAAVCAGAAAARSRRRTSPPLVAPCCLWRVRSHHGKNDGFDHRAQWAGPYWTCILGAHVLR
eukprot:2701297-Prymnesium_polylepis.1